MKISSIFCSGALALLLTACGISRYAGVGPVMPPTSTVGYVTTVGHHAIPAVPAQLMHDSLPALTKRCKQALATAYMAKKCLATLSDVPGWEGYPVKLYEYYTPVDSLVKCRKRALVYMLNPSPKKLATWVATTVWATMGNLDYSYTQGMIEWIVYQSNCQFPVSGIVYEDMEQDGTWHPYYFKDGVTCYIADSTWLRRDDHPTDAMLRYYLHATNAQLEQRTGQYARICSATREQYYAYGGTQPVGSAEPRSNRKLLWLDVVRTLYQKAWNSDYNEIMLMWAAQNLRQVHDLLPH